MKKMVGVATDGAAVMTGKKSGVVQRLKQDTARYPYHPVYSPPTGPGLWRCCRQDPVPRQMPGTTK